MNSIPNSALSIPHHSTLLMNPPSTLHTSMKFKFKTKKATLSSSSFPDQLSDFQKKRLRTLKLI